MAVCLHSLLLKSNISLFLSRYTSPFQIYTLCIHPHWLKECTLTLICLACLSCACDEWYLFCSGPWGSHILAAINNVDGMPWPQRGLQSANGEMWSRGQCVFSSVYFQFNPHPSLIPWSQFVWRLLRSQKEWKSQIEGSLWGCFVLDRVLKALLATKRGKRGVFQLSSHSLSQLFLKGGGGVTKNGLPPAVLFGGRGSTCERQRLAQHGSVLSDLKTNFTQLCHDIWVNISIWRPKHRHTLTQTLRPERTQS